MSSYYLHRPLGEQVEAIGGSYRLDREVRLPLEDRNEELFYLVGYALFDTTCCGTGGCGYAHVQGYLRRWKAHTSSDGVPMTEVELITDEAAQAELRQLIISREKVQQVNFRQ
jgi:hypothetical protein